MSCFTVRTETAPTVTLRWDDLPGRILVKNHYDDMGAYSQYYRIIKQNEKSAWIARCDRDGRCWTLMDGWTNERWSRSQIPRIALA
jgi:hypothetical protein